MANDFYAHPTAMTSAGRYAPLFNTLSKDVAELVRIVQSQLLHEHLAAYAYDVALSDEHRAETHLRPAEQMIERRCAREGEPFVALPAEQRVVGTCRNFTVLLVAITIQSECERKRHDN